MILGIASLALFWVPFLPIVLAVIAIILAIGARKQLANQPGRAMATVGLVLAIIGLVVGVIYGIIWIAAGSIICSAVNDPSSWSDWSSSW
jgi:hypothetical protein